MNSNSCPFLVVSWNVRGLGDSDKCNLVRNVFSDAKPSVICIQETKLATIDLFKAKSFLPTNFATSFVLAPAEGTRGGLLTAWDASFFSLDSHFLKPHTLTTALTCNATSLDFTITNTYGPSDHAGSLPFLQNLQDLTHLISGPWILLGDFNLVRCAADKNIILLAGEKCRFSSTLFW
jgi:exonuclease III